MPGRAIAAGEDDGEKGERQADDLEERCERCDDQHSVEKRGLFRQQEDGRRGEKDPGSGDRGADSASTRARKSESKNSESCDRDDRLGRREFEKVEIIHGDSYKVKKLHGYRGGTAIEHEDVTV